MKKEEILEILQLMKSASNMQINRMNAYPDIPEEKEKELLEMYCNVQQGFIEALRNNISIKSVDKQM